MGWVVGPLGALILSLKMLTWHCQLVPLQAQVMLIASEKAPGEPVKDATVGLTALCLVVSRAARAERNGVDESAAYGQALLSAQDLAIALEGDLATAYHYALERVESAMKAALTAHVPSEHVHQQLGEIRAEWRVAVRRFGWKRHWPIELQVALIVALATICAALVQRCGQAPADGAPRGTIEHGTVSHERDR